MKIRVISDLHYYLNLTYSPTEFTDILNKIEPADVTLIAGDMACDTEEALAFLQKYFLNELVLFTAGNHDLCVYKSGNSTTVQEVIANYRATFNPQTFAGNWIYLENDFFYLGNNIFVIGCTGWTNFEYGHQTKSQYIQEINREKARREKEQFIDTDKVFGKEYGSGMQRVIYCGYLPDDPASYYDELQMGNMASYRGRRMRDAVRYMNDYNYGKMRGPAGTIDILTPYDTYRMHQESLNYIREAYKEITSKFPDATIILMTHHPFSTKCVSGRYKDDPLTAAFVSPHDRWLKKFPNIKYVVSGHVHQRFYKKLADKIIINNPCGYVHYNEHKADVPFDPNFVIEI